METAPSLPLRPFAGPARAPEKRTNAAESPSDPRTQEKAARKQAARQRIDQLRERMKAYRGAGGTGPALSTAPPDAARLEAQEMEAKTDQDFAKLARGLIRRLRTLLGAASKDADPRSAQGKTAEAVTRDFRDHEKLLDGIEGDANGAEMASKLLSRLG